MLSLMKVWVTKHKNDMYACTCSTPSSYIDCLAFELSKFKIRGHNVFDGFFKIGLHNR